MSSPESNLPPAMRNGRQGWEVWLPDTTAGEAIGWACKELTTYFVLMVGGLRNRHRLTVVSAFSGMYLVLDRLLEFVYSKHPEWRQGKVHGE